jgi:hypothetical protein
MTWIFGLPIRVRRQAKRAIAKGSEPIAIAFFIVSTIVLRISFENPQRNHIKKINISW